MITTTEPRPAKQGTKKPTKPTKKPPTVSAETPAAIAPTAMDLPSQLLPVEQCERHPQNRNIDTTGAAFTQLVDSIREHGQREPGRVRRWNGGYQILSGERRFLACQAAGAKTFLAVVVDVDDSQALAEVALGNAARQDLDPVERAELLKTLLDTGMDRSAAGRLFGLTSESGVKNALRIGKLPDSIKQLIRSGDLPERAARRLVPYTAAPPIMDAIAKAIADAHTANHWQWPEILADLCRTSTEKNGDAFGDEVCENSRPMNPKIRTWANGRVIEMLFKRDQLTAEQIASLEIVDLPAYGERALNIAAWDAFNAPFVAKLKAAYDRRNGGTSTKPTKADSSKPQTDADRRREEANRLKIQEQKLDQYTDQWFELIIRASLAELDTQLIAKTAKATLPALAAIMGHNPSFSNLVTAAGREMQIKQRTVDAASCLEHDLTTAVFRLILWPVSRLSKTSSHVLSKAGEIPERLPTVDPSDLRAIATACSFEFAHAWKLAGLDGCVQRELLTRWLQRHTKDQLHKLRNELNVTEGGSHMGRDELAGCILNAHRTGRPLNIPQRIARLINPTKKAKR
jgi:ParB family transcriptional regulator, chromosome partitioning protein